MRDFKAASRNLNPARLPVSPHPHELFRAASYPERAQKGNSGSGETFSPTKSPTFGSLAVLVTP